MIIVEKIDCWGFEHAIRGMRNHMNSWEKSDSDFEISCESYYCPHIANYKRVIGENDLGLMRRLYAAGPEHRKYLRQIMVSMDITAPLYWWKEFDTYKVGTVANSCSTMHKIADHEFALDDFSHEHLLNTGMSLLTKTIEILNLLRNVYIKGNLIYPKKSKEIWWQMIQLLPSSYNQKRTVTMNYENVMTIIKQRTGHKLDEWNDFCEILKRLPYIEEIRGVSNDG